MYAQVKCAGLFRKPNPGALKVLPSVRHQRFHAKNRECHNGHDDVNDPAQLLQATQILVRTRKHFGILDMANAQSIQRTPAKKGRRCRIEN
jgi:hypothetical protein